MARPRGPARDKARGRRRRLPLPAPLTACGAVAGVAARGLRPLCLCPRAALQSSSTDHRREETEPRWGPRSRPKQSKCALPLAALDLGGTAGKREARSSLRLCFLSVLYRSHQHFAGRQACVGSPTAVNLGQTPHCGPGGWGGTPAHTGEQERRHWGKESAGGGGRARASAARGRGPHFPAPAHSALALFASRRVRSALRLCAPPVPTSSFLSKCCKLFHCRHPFHFFFPQHECNLRDLLPAMTDNAITHALINRYLQNAYCVPQHKKMLVTCIWGWRAAACTSGEARGSPAHIEATWASAEAAAQASPATQGWGLPPRATHTVRNLAPSG